MHTPYASGSRSARSVDAAPTLAQVPPLAAVVFDLDGTLFDHPTASRLAVRDWLTERGVAPTADLLQAWSAAEARHRHWREGRVSFLEQRRGRLRDVLPLLGAPVGTDAELDAVFARYLVAYERAWAGYDDVDAAIDAVHALGLVTAVLTNGGEGQQQAKLARLGLLERVGPVFTAEGLGVAKPSPEAFLRVCEALGVAPEQVLYVGDEHEVDVLAARAAGLRALYLDRLSAGPDTEVERASSLADLAERLAR